MTLLIALGAVLFVLVLLGGGVVLFRTLAATVPAAMAESARRPFTYGVPPQTFMGCTRSSALGVGGQAATLSFRDPFDASRSWGSGNVASTSGRVVLEVSLGPDWPAMGVRRRDLTLPMGRWFSRRNGIPRTEVPTGDPGFDAHYVAVVTTGDPGAVRRVLTPPVLAALGRPPVAQLDVFHTLVLQYDVPVGARPEDGAPAAIACAETILRGGAFPLHTGPPHTVTPA